jgi:AcrR family transcriptional regulator
MGRRKLVANIDDKIMVEVMKMTMKVGTGLVSTKEIAKKLGISEPVIFTHFKTKVDLMDATFVKACIPLLNDQIAKVCFEKGCSATFEDYKPALIWALSFKKETVYIHHYLASSYYNDKVVHEALRPFFEQARKALKALAPENPLSTEQYDFLLVTYFHTRIDILNGFLQGRFPINDDYLRLMDYFLVGGTFAALGIERPNK